jgi:hypothetical protein
MKKQSPRRDVSLTRSVVAALLLTGAWAVASWSLAPSTGLLRSLHSNTAFTGEPLEQDRTGDVSLAFLESHPELTRRFSVRWQGTWFFPEQQVVELHVRADDYAAVHLDGALVLQHQVNDRAETTDRTFTVGSGSHDITIEFQQYDGNAFLSVEWSPPGGPRRALPSSQLFAGQVTAHEYRIATGLRWLRLVAIAAWLISSAIAVAWVARRLPALIVAADKHLREGWGSRAELPGAVVRLMRRTGRSWSENSRPRSLREYGRRLYLVASPALLGPVVLFLAGPHTVFTANRQEFAAPFVDIAVPWLVVVVGVSWAVLVLIGGIASYLSRKLTRMYAVVLFALGLLAWMQGNLWVGDYGVLVGEELDFSLQAWRAPYEIGVWLGVVALALAFSKSISKIVPLASQLFIALQAVVLVAAMAWPSGSRAGTESGMRTWQPPPDQIYELSRARNVIHIVLDGFLSAVFGEALEKERATFDRDFSGFVFFADHLGAFPTTRGSMPAMLTGMTYRNEMPFDEFLREIDDNSIFNVLGRQGYRINSATFHPTEHPNVSQPGRDDAVLYTIPTPYGSYRDYVEFAAATLLDLSLFRHVPHVFKGQVYNSETWLFQSRYSEREGARRARASNHAAFLDEFTSKLRTTGERPVYTFVHVAIPHPPIVTGADCSFIGVRRTTRSHYAMQARCGLLVVQHLLDRLRTLGVYDQSAIVLTADHGWGVLGDDHPLRGVRSPAGNLERVAVSAMPLLAIKPAGSVGPLRISQAPTSITDIPATILDLAGLPEGSLPGQSILKIDESVRRSRAYAQHSWTNAGWSRPYFDLLRLFSVEGPVLDPKSWTFQAALFEPAADLRAQLEEHQTGLFDIEQDADGPFRWGDVHVVTYAPPDARTFVLKARKTSTAPPSVTLSVRIDGHVVARRAISDSWITLEQELPIRMKGANPFCIELLLDPQWRSSGARGRNVMYRDLGWR